MSAFLVLRRTFEMIDREKLSLTAQTASRSDKACRPALETADLDRIALNRPRLGKSKQRESFIRREKTRHLIDFADELGDLDLSIYALEIANDIHACLCSFSIAAAAMGLQRCS